MLALHSTMKYVVVRGEFETDDPQINKITNDQTKTTKHMDSRLRWE
jgi:hypothetical protein